MNRNPYSPPNAAVADVTAPPARATPAAVRRALYLFVASFVLNIVIAIIWQRYPEPNAYAELSLMALVASMVFGLVLLLWLGWKIAIGRNWARIVLLVLTLISIPPGFYEILELAQVRPIISGFKLVEQGLDIAVIYLLFFPAREFFRPPAR